MRKWEKLTYTNEVLGASIVFSHTSMYHVNIKKDVSGLSDVVSTVYSVSSMGQDGSTKIGTRIEARDIEIVGHFNTIDKTEIHRLRRNMNRILNPHDSATLTYEFDGVTRVISCTPDSAPVFDNREKLFERFSIQLVCLNPFWRDASETREDVAIWEGGMEFPTETGGLELTDDWEIGFRSPSLIANVNNVGDVSTGLRVVFRALASLSNPEIINVNTGEFIRVNTEMEAGDLITVTTGYGQKAVTLNRNGNTSDIFRLLDVDSTYMQARVGDNLYRYDADSGVDNLEVTIYHNNLYLGV